MPSGSSASDKPSVCMDWGVARRFAKIVVGFWSEAGAGRARFITLGLAGFLILRLFVDMGVNAWNRWFFDAVGNRDVGEALRAVSVFLLLVCATAAVGVGIVWTRETLQVRWREWCTRRLLDRWIADQRFLRLARSDKAIANPEYRISDDVRLAIEPLTDFAIGIFTAVLGASVFIGVLWSVGGSLSVSVGVVEVTIPAFMVISAIIYGVTVSCLVPVVGRNLGAATAARNESEALFRAQTLQLRESAEGITLIGAEPHLRGRLDATYSQLVLHWLAMVRQHCNVTWVMNANSALVPTVPILLALPKYMAGQLTLGETMQLASAFVQVQLAICWLTDNYRQVAEWFASARRVVELVDALDDIDDPSPQENHYTRMSIHGGDAVILGAISLCDGSGEKVIEAASATFFKGEKIVVQGEAESGKAALARAILGLWPWGGGYLTTPADRGAVMAHATPYLPEGTLEDALQCPASSGTFLREDIESALASCGVPHLVDRLDHHSRWMHTLSANERQRCALARLILHQPSVIVLEDALSACDANAQSQLMRMLFDCCPSSLIIDLSNRLAPAALYDRCFILTRNGDGPSMLSEVMHSKGSSRMRSGRKAASFPGFLANRSNA